jgi:acyl-CoA synthetase (AMP-forming)/AMP-acid ligase II/aryl carrier-like protein
MLSRRSIDGLIRAHARAQPDAPALLAPGSEPCSYASLAAHLDATVVALRAALPDTNRIIALALGSDANGCAALVAAMAAGVCAPVDPATSAAEMDAFLAHVHPALVIVDEAGLARHGSAFAHHGVRVARLAGRAGRMAGVFDLNVPAALGPPGDPLVDPASSVVLLLRTSGSTGEPKMVPHTMHRLMHAIDASCALLSIDSGDRCLNARPLYHVHAIVHIIGSSLVGGASIVFPRQIGARALIDGCATWKPTWYSASPALHRDVLAVLQTRSATFEHVLRFVRSAGAPLDPLVTVAVETALGVPMIEGYGATEAPTVTISPLPPQPQRPGSVGRALGCEVRIVDGEVWARGENVAPAYATRGQAQPIVDDDGWYHTGDVGYLDADGFLFLTGRFSERINVGGVKISPETVERALRAYPGVADAVAFALPHPTLGEHVAAIVVMQPGAAFDGAVLSGYTRRTLPTHAVPNVIRAAGAIQRDGNGKLRRHELATALVRELEAERSAPGRKPADTDSLRHALTRIWEDILERSPIDLEENFFAAGGDSMRSLRLTARVAETFGVDLSPDTLLAAPTIDALADAVVAAARRGKPSRLLALRASGSRPALFFYDGDINGGGLYCRFLLDAFGTDQPIYLIRPAGVFGDDVPAVEAMAEADVALITSVAPAGPYRLAGFCNGGTVAFEVARRLEAAGARVDVLALVASSALNARLAWLAKLCGGNDTVFRLVRRVANRLRGGSLIEQMPDIVRGLSPWTTGKKAHFAGPEFVRYGERLLHYFPQRYERAIDLIWADDDYPPLPGDPTMGWGYVTRVRRHTMRGTHVTMLTDHVGELGVILRRIVDAADAETSPRGYMPAGTAT